LPTAAAAAAAAAAENVEEQRPCRDKVKAKRLVDFYLQ
jgi:hypothetical protein